MPDENPVKIEEKSAKPDAKAPEVKTASDVGIGEARATRFPRYFSVVFAFLFIIFIPLEIFDGLEDRWMGRMFRMRGMEQADPRISIVTIDDASLKRIGVYPWPRGVYADLMDKLFEHGVAVVGFDVLFHERSGKPKEDQKLIDATRRYRKKVVHAMMVKPTPGSYTLQHDYPFKGLREVTKNFGNVVQHMIDLDGQVRGMVITAGKSQEGGWVSDPDRVPALAISMLGVFDGSTIDTVIEKLGDNGMFLNIRGEKKIKRWNEQAGEDLEIATVYGINRVPAWEILDDEADEDAIARLKGGIVFVGLTAAGAFDHYPSPFSEMSPGVEVHATQIDNILNERWINPPFVWGALIITIFMIFLAYRIVSLRPVYAAIGLVVVCIGWTAIVYFAFVNLVIIEFIPPIIAFIGTYLVLIIHRTMMEQQAKAEVRQMFGQYVSPDVVDILVKDPKKLSLGGTKRDMTIFFLDIAHFTTISEKMTPEDLIKFLNRYLTALTDDILNNNGVVDKYIGDCIMAFWNAPLEVKGHRAKACIAAVNCIGTIERLNAEYVDPSMPETPAVRIGLNSGEVVVGNTGSARKLAYTVLGDEVNLSSRLEGANKFFGSTIMASEDTFDDEAKALIEGRELGKVRVVGKEIPIMVYELLGKKGEIDASWEKALPLYHAGVALYNDRKFVEAKAKFQEVLTLKPEDKPTKLYLNVCEDYIVIPPPADQELVFNLTSK